MKTIGKMEGEGMHRLYLKLLESCVDYAGDAWETQPWNMDNMFPNFPKPVKEAINEIIENRPPKSTYEDICQYYLAALSLLHQSKGVMHPGAVFLVGYSIQYINKHY